MDATESRRSYEEILPKPAKYTFLFWLSIIGNACSILGLLAFAIAWQHTEKVTTGYTVIILHVTFAIFALTILFYSYCNLSRSRYRYANMAYYTHYVNHVVRDYTADLLSQKQTQPLNDVLKDLVTAIANCFSVITGTHCRCCIKSLESDFTITTFARDIISSQTTKIKKEKSHLLKDNTDFFRLWHMLRDCERVYVSNNLPREYAFGRYQNSSLDKDLWFWTWWPLAFVPHWPLPYKSTLVAPIRYLERLEPPTSGYLLVQDPLQYLGFLCIDSASKRSFRDPLLIELAGGFADCLYVLLDNYDYTYFRR